MKITAFAAVCALLLAGASCSGDGDSSRSPPAASESTAPPSPGDAGGLTAEQAVQRVLSLLAVNRDLSPDPDTAKATRMTEREAEQAIRDRGPGGQPPVSPTDRPVWLVEVRGDFRAEVCRDLAPEVCPAPENGLGTLFRILSLEGEELAGTVVFDQPAASPS
jgi:hypothetical protein